MYSIKDLSVFARTAQSESFADAASSLGMTPSAVGKIIQKIEDRHNIRLFTRSTRNICLTDEGRVLLHHAARILGEFDEAVTAFSDLKNGYQGKLKISIPNIDTLFSSLLATFIDLHPQIELEVHLDDGHCDIIKDGFDAVIRFGDISDSRLFSKKIGSLSMGVFHSKNYTPSEFISDNRFLFYRYPYSGKIESWNNTLQFDIKKIRQHKTFNSISMICQLCHAGAGIAYLPEIICQRLLSEGEMVRMENSLTTSRSINIVWPNNRHVGLKLRAFIDHFANALPQHLQSHYQHPAPLT